MGRAILLSVAQACDYSCLSLGPVFQLPSFYKICSWTEKRIGKGEQQLVSDIPNLVRTVCACWPLIAFCQPLAVEQYSFGRFSGHISALHLPYAGCEKVTP